MSRRRSDREAVEPPEVILDLEASIAALKSLCETYDKGARNVAPSMSVEIIKILDSNKVTKGIASKKRFGRVETSDCDSNLIAECPLVHPKLSGTGHNITVDFVAAFEVFWTIYKECDFVEWWNEDIIYRASSAHDPFGSIDAAPTFPRPQSTRFTLNRSSFVRSVRNQRGAHIDEAVARELKHLDRARSFGLQFAYLQDGISIEPRIVGSPLKTMIRQIAEEVLLAYGHSVGVWGRFGEGEGVIPHLSMTYGG